MKPRIQWVVQAGDGADISAIVEQMRAKGVDTEGRIFVNGRPAEDDDIVYEGDYVELWPERPLRDSSEVRIVAQRDGVIVAYKPAGVPTETTQLSQTSAKSLLLERLGGGALHAASRLDTSVSGLVLFALGRNAARRIEKWRERRAVKRSYIAIAHGTIDDDGCWQWPLRKMRDAGGRPKSVIGGAKPKAAITDYQVLARIDDTSVLLLFRPQTGRFHQLRAHAARAGLPLWGDRLYGGKNEVSDADGRVHLISRVALHAIALDLPALDAYAAPPPELATLWQRLGGDEESWTRTAPRGVGALTR